MHNYALADVIALAVEKYVRNAYFLIPTLARIAIIKELHLTHVTRIILYAIKIKRKMKNDWYFQWLRSFDFYQFQQFQQFKVGKELHLL